MPTPTAPTIALLISHAERDGYFHIHADARVVLPTGKVEYARWEHSTIGGILLEDFQVSCQGHTSLNGQSDAGRLYAFRHGYDVSFVEPFAAANMAKSFAKIKRRLAKLYAQRGSADTFAEYVIRIAEVIGAAEILAYTKATAAWGQDREYRRMSLGDGRYHIAALAREWTERATPPAAKAASA